MLRNAKGGLVPRDRHHNCSIHWMIKLNYRDRESSNGTVKNHKREKEGRVMMNFPFLSRKNIGCPKLIAQLILNSISRHGLRPMMACIPQQLTKDCVCPHLSLLPNNKSLKVLVYHI